MCNAWNHSPDCDCGWGGNGNFGGYGGHGGGGYGGGGYSTGRVTFEGTPFEFPYVTYPSYVNPNAECPVCGASVYFYQSPYGGRVFFDELGPPWPKHPCTDSGDPLRNFSTDENRARFRPVGGNQRIKSESGEGDAAQPLVPKVAAVQPVLAPWVEAGWMPFVVTRILPRRIGIEVEGKLFSSAGSEGVAFRIEQTSPDARFYRARAKLWIGYSLVQNTSLILSALNECPILLKKDPDLQNLALSSFILTPARAVEEISFNVFGFDLE